MVNATTPMTAVFGPGYFGAGMTGLIRIPALMASATAVAILGEVAFRGLRLAYNGIGKLFFNAELKKTEPTWAEKLTEGLPNIRPFAQYTPRELAVSLVALTIFSILATELVRLLAGNPHPIYNNVLAFFGPIRIADGSYLDGIYPILSSVGVV